MSRLDDMKIENVWIVLGKIVAGVVAWAPFIHRELHHNGEEITLKLGDFQYSCGYTQDVSNLLFARRHRQHRNRLSEFGVTFLNTKQRWDYKKICIDYTNDIPSFYNMFVAHLPVEVQQPHLPDQPELALDPRYNVNLKGKTTHTIHAGNNKRVVWMKVNNANGVASNWDNFRYKLAVPTIKTLLSTAAGNVDNGVRFMVRQLLRINKQVVSEELNDCGLGVFTRLTPKETVALTVGSGISNSARVYIGRILKLHNNNKPIFACEKKCKSIKPKHVVAPTFAVYKYDEEKSKTDNTIVQRRVEYWVTDAWEVLLCELRNVRDSKTHNTDIGVKQGELGIVIPVGVQGDSGGGEMKVVLDMLLKEDDTRNYCKQICSIKGKEDAKILLNTVMKKHGGLNDSIEKMNNNKVLVVKWDAPTAGFDFVTVPERVGLDDLEFIRVGVNERELQISWDIGDNGDNAAGIARFDRMDIPENYNVNLLKTVPFSGGDLAYQFIILGRANHCGSKCMLCTHRAIDWKYQPQHDGTLFCMESMKQDRADLEAMAAYIKLNPTDEYDVDTDIGDIIKDYVMRNGEYGFKGLDVMLPAIAMSNYLVPPLHIMLGIGNNLIEKFKGFIENNLEDVTRPDAPVSAAFFAMLGSDYNVVRQKYHTQTLVGGDIHRMLQNHAQIVHRTRAIFKDIALRKADTTADIDARIDTFMDNMLKLMRVFNSIYALMSQTTQLSPVQLDHFDYLCKNFGLMWRMYLNPCNATPKLHLLETHAPVQMRKFGCLGDKIEAAVERMHHSVNKANRRYAAVRGWDAKQAITLSYRDQSELEEVAEQVRNDINRTKRVFSPEVTARKDQESLTSSAAKKARILQSVDTVDLLRIEFNITT